MKGRLSTKRAARNQARRRAINLFKKQIEELEVHISRPHPAEHRLEESLAAKKATLSHILDCNDEDCATCELAGAHA